MLAFQTSGSGDVKKYIIHFMEEAWLVLIIITYSWLILFFRLREDDNITCLQNAKLFGSSSEIAKIVSSLMCNLL